MTTDSCESCGIPIESGHCCVHCTDESGALEAFDSRFAKVVAWQTRRAPQSSSADIERDTFAYLATMPAWRDHPRVRAAAS